MANKNKLIGFRLDPETFSELETESKKLGMNISEYIRMLVEQRKNKKIETVNQYDKITLNVDTHDLEDLIVDYRNLASQVNKICSTAIKTDEIYKPEIEKVAAALEEIKNIFSSVRLKVFDDRQKIRAEAKSFLKSKGLL